MSEPHEIERRAVCDGVWAARLVYADALNDARLAAWRARWPCVREADLPGDHVRIVAASLVRRCNCCNSNAPAHGGA